MIRLLNPELVFLSETRRYSDYVESLKTRLNMFGFAVDRVCLSGGLALLWRKDVDASLPSFSQHHIDAQVQLQSDMGKWWFTGFYGVPKQHLLYGPWDLIRL